MRVYAGCTVLAVCLICWAVPMPARTASAHAGLAPRVAPPRWTPVGPTAGYVLAMASSAQALYAGGVGGVFVSRDAARSWQPLNHGLQGRIVRSLAVGPPDGASPTAPLLIATTTDGLVFASADGGASWRRAMAGLGARTVSALALAPHG